MNAVVFVSDRGNKYLPGCLQSYYEHVDESLVDRMFVVDDRLHHLGMAGAVQRGFDLALSVGADYVLWIEEDFRFHDLPLKDMQQILADNPHLAQVVLKRQPWSAEEVAAGGVIEKDPDDYKQQDGFVEHRRLFSLNPCLIRREVLELGWPSGPIGVGNETGFTERCLAAGYSFAYYGRIEDPPRCMHVGDERAEGWRL